MEKWKEGDLNSLLNEGRTIQDRLPKTYSDKSEQQLSRSFANMMFQGKIQAALQLLSNKGKGSVLHLNDVYDDSTTVKDILKKKHPEGVIATSDSTIRSIPPCRYSSSHF